MEVGTFRVLAVPWRILHPTNPIGPALDEIDGGFSSGHVNLSFNKYGAGVYFSRDPRLAHFFLRQARQDDHAECKIILCRVVVGWCVRKAAIRNKHHLLRPEHRKPPEGFQSVTSEDVSGREVVVFPGNPCTPAYPAYVLTYTTPFQSDPYRDGPTSKRWRSHFKSHLKKPFTIAHTATAKEDFVKRQLSGRAGDCHRLKSLEQTTFPYITREEKLEVLGMG